MWKNLGFFRPNRPALSSPTEVFLCTAVDKWSYMFFEFRGGECECVCLEWGDCLEFCWPGGWSCAVDNGQMLFYMYFCVWCHHLWSLASLYVTLFLCPSLFNTCCVFCVCGVQAPATEDAERDLATTVMWPEVMGIRSLRTLELWSQVHSIWHHSPWWNSNIQQEKKNIFWLEGF